MQVNHSEDGEGLYSVADSTENDRRSLPWDQLGPFVLKANPGFRSLAATQIYSMLA